MTAVRALIATAGLLLVAGAAAAATSRPFTLRTSATPVAAVTQDGGEVGWLADGGSKCNLVYVMTPKGTRTFPKPAPKSMTCRWDLSSGRPRLALAAASTAVAWTLHKNGSTSVDYVMTAKIGGKEAQVDRLAHDSDGTGWWLGDLAGGGTTLAYSSVDVEYVDKLGCLSGGSCKKMIAGGGIKLVSGSSSSALAGAGPALDLAVASNRIAYIAATTVAKNGSPAPNAVTPVQVVDAHTGTPVIQAAPDGTPLAIALSPHILAVLTRKGSGDRLTWYDAATGVKLAGIAVPRATVPQIGATDTTIVYRVGRELRGVTLAKRHAANLSRVAASFLGLSVQGKRAVWAENAGKTSAIRSLVLR